jgi:mono/diheme cytochrome c family protein
MRKFVAMFALVISAVGLSRPAIADDANVEFFEKKIRPLLVSHCFECHSANAKKLGGKLLLDSRDGVRTGGDSGAAIQPGKPDDSLLIKAVRYTDDSVKMPPKGKLPAAAIADLEEWIKRGAPDPRDKPTRRDTEDAWDDVFRERAKWWSYQPVKKPAVPQPKNDGWSDHPVDRFVLARLEERGLTPAEPADPRTLARR